MEVQCSALETHQSRRLDSVCPVGELSRLLPLDCGLDILVDLDPGGEWVKMGLTIPNKAMHWLVQIEMHCICFCVGSDMHFWLQVAVHWLKYTMHFASEELQ